jgi:hypothetical protein
MVMRNVVQVDCRTGRRRQRHEKVDGKHRQEKVKQLEAIASQQQLARLDILAGIQPDSSIDDLRVAVQALAKLMGIDRV